MATYQVCTTSKPIRRILTFKRRFKSGSVFNKQKTLDIEDLSGWIIAVRVNVKTIGAAGPALKKPTPAQIEKNRLAYEAVLKTLDGNALHYSIERLYADMGSMYLESARW